jgi:hypothetical protein
VTTIAKCGLEAKYAENAQTTQYTAATGVRTIVDKFTATNVTASAATLAVNIVASGGSASAANVILQTKTLASGECYTCPELVGQILNAGDFVSTLAGTASAIVIRMSGREVN